jgi:hypothetical protein
MILMNADSLVQSELSGKLLILSAPTVPDLNYDDLE